MKHESQSVDAVNAASRIREGVSALMDGEAEELELRRLLSGEHASSVNETWQRYHQVRDVLRGHHEVEPFRQLDISLQVSAAIAEENGSNQIDDKSRRRPAWLRPVAGFAVAASVAAGLVVSIQATNQSLPGALPEVSSAPIASNRAYPVAGNSMQAAAGSAPRAVVNYPTQQLPVATLATQSTANQEAQQHLEKYLLRHTENAALNTGQGVMTFARVASFEVE